MRENETRTQKLLSLILIVCCVLFVLWGCHFYLTSIQKSLVDQAIGNVLTVTQQQEQAFDNFLTRDMDRIHSFALYFSQTNSNDVAEIQDKLTAFDDVEAVYSVVNLDTGAFYNNKTRQTFKMTVGQLWDYQRLGDQGVRNSYMGLYNGKNMFGYYERFTFADGARGLFQKGYDNTQVCDEFSLSFYDDQGFSYVVTDQGEILLRSQNEGNSSHQSLGSSFTNIFDIVDLSHDSEQHINDFKRALANSETGMFQFEGEYDTFVYTYVPLERVDDWYLISIVPMSAIMTEADKVIYNSHVMFIVLLAVMAVILTFVWLASRVQRNIKLKNKEIEYQEQLFNSFFVYLSNNTDDVYLILNLQDNKFVAEYVSPNVERILGYSVDAVLKDLTVLGRAEYQDGRTIEYEDLHNLAAGETINVLETQRFNNQLGESRFFRELVSCIEVLGEKKIMVYIADRTREREVQNTLRTALDAARLASKAKSSFLSSVSHDIRTPMNAIVGLVALLRDEANDRDRVLEYTSRIDSASRHLLGLINDVLDMNKIESGTTALNISDLNLADIIDELNTIIRPQAKAKNQKFQIFASSFTYEHLLGDKMRINQVLINILSNSVKYTPEGGNIVMSIQELPQILQNYTRIQIDVQDDGQGMSREYQEIMFEPFTREQNTTTNKIQGTGLGMAITKSLVDLMGGSIKVESELGKGTKFTVELELRIQEQQQKEDTKFWYDNGLGRMLVVDDDQDICKNVVKAMGGTGVNVEYVTSGAAALQRINSVPANEKPYDLILLDWYMPEMDGLETARKIRQDKKHEIPIVMLTAYDWEEIGPQAMDIGIDHFLQKPFFVSNFKEAVSRIMGGGKSKKDSKTLDVIKGRHILIVEDIEVNRMILVKIMTSRGATCDIAVNGQEAVEIFTRSKPGTFDIILMDVQMPIMNGYEATKAIRASSHADAKDVPIVAMTANAFADDVRAALDSGMDAHVAKPIILENLENTLRDVLHYKKKRDNPDK